MDRRFNFGENPGLPLHNAAPSLLEEVLHVPLLFISNRLHPTARGKRIEEVASLCDLQVRVMYLFFFYFVSL